KNEGSSGESIAKYAAFEEESAFTNLSDSQEVEESSDSWDTVSEASYLEDRRESSAAEMAFASDTGEEDDASPDLNFPGLEPESGQPEREFRRRPSRRVDRRGRPFRRMSGRPGAGRPKPPIQEIFR